MGCFAVFSRCSLFAGACSIASVAVAQLVIVPGQPSPVDTVRLRWFHVGCTNPDSVRSSMQNNRVTISADRTFGVDCGTTQNYFDEYTVGRLPSGEYDVDLIVNPPPGTAGPSLLLGPVHLAVAPLPATGSLLPHDDYSDMWLVPEELGQSLVIKQSGAQLVALWTVYDAAGQPTWYTLQPGSWVRDASNTLVYSAIVFKTTGPYWALPFDPAALSITPVGTASFVPQSVSRARFDYTIDGIAGSKQLQRFVF